jgi:D-glycero-alpha-D-manno-heptose 1-phosphate guanylyltransferase
MINDVKAVLLVGGLGSRLRPVLPSTPKVLASVGTMPFLQLLVGQLHAQGIRRLVMCTGYLADQVEKQFGDGRAFDVTIDYSREAQPLGTAGAIGLAKHLLQDVPEFLVMNGDSFLEVDFLSLMSFHRARQAVATIAVRRVENTCRYGTVRMDAKGRVIGFAEKQGSDVPGVVNGGVYVFSHAVLQYIPTLSGSLENDIFPRLLSEGVYAQEQRGLFIDIGTPEDYLRAQQLCDSLKEVASGGRLPSTVTKS